ncbi:phosphopantothenoylcysteine decarboxylase [Roseiconus nitratireducens]|uniref:Phosphopantothenoylcysteine decarboxylase n=1 Tax=Roseiconus nitratireducens TaxID=2605748 RepID=A0A5M6DCP5_9BACT|nr:flavoprotein [Roseiconus nitratireducens]KAA5543849.1 phosphopantothenoylcysteine decarboxylase [Roseiconus nitratireducens]
MAHSKPARRILLAVGGGIAAYKSATVCSRLAQAGHDVQTVMTRSATEFLGSATLAALSGKPVAMDSFDAAAHPLGSHIELALRLDLMIIAPATANLLAKLAVGIADDLLSTLYLQTEAPVLLAPAMSDPMWRKAAVQRNLDQLRSDGCHIVGPESGWLSCRVRGMGRMSEPETILESAMRILDASDED